MQLQGRADAAAVFISGLCLVHCLIWPVLLVAVPALAVVVAIPHSFHEIALMVAVPTSMVALGLGWRQHRRWLPTLLALPGLALLAVGEYAFHGAAIEPLFAVSGAAILVAAHGLNWLHSRAAVALGRLPVA